MLGGECSKRVTLLFERLLHMIKDITKSQAIRLKLPCFSIVHVCVHMFLMDDKVSPVMGK